MWIYGIIKYKHHYKNDGLFSSNSKPKGLSVFNSSKLQFLCNRGWPKVSKGLYFRWIICFKIWKCGRSCIFCPWLLLSVSGHYWQIHQVHFTTCSWDKIGGPNDPSLLGHTPWCWIVGALNFFKIWIFLHIFVALLHRAHFPKGIRLKLFQYEMRAIFTESLVHETLFNTQ